MSEEKDSCYNCASRTMCNVYSRVSRAFTDYKTKEEESSDDWQTPRYEFQKFIFISFAMDCYVYVRKD